MSHQTTHVDETFDYTSRDFSSLIADVVRRMRSAIPGWDASPSSFEMILLEQMAYVGDILNYYIDRMAAESYIQTAVLRESVLNLAYAFGYVPTAQTAARTDVAFTKATGLGNVVVPAGTQVFATVEGTSVIFETVATLTITGASGSIEVAEGETVVEESLGVSTGAERMQFPLFHRNVIKDSIRFLVAEGPFDPSRAGPALVPWTQINRVIEADPIDRVFTVFVDDQGTSYIRLGDGVSGRIPPVNASLFATYRHGRGALGNVPIGAIKSLVTGGSLSAQITSMTNAAAASGGADAESLASMRINIPRSLRSLDRAVTAQDYADLALQVSGVAKASANGALSTNIIVCAVPFSGGAPGAQLTDEINKYLATRKMVGTTVSIIGPVSRPFDITVSIAVNNLFVQENVKLDVERRLAEYYAFDVVELGGSSRLSDIYSIISGTDGVVSTNVTAHHRSVDSPSLQSNVSVSYNELPVAGTITVTATGGIVPV